MAEVESPYEKALREGRLDEFTRLTDDIYSSPERTQQAVSGGVNLYQPNTYAGYGGTSAPRQYTAEEEAFLKNNPGDEGRMAQALASNNISKTNAPGGSQSSGQFPGGNQFSDPYSKLLEQIAQEQLGTLRQPQSNPQLDQLMQFLNTRFSELSQNPGYSPAEQSLLRTQAIEPIEQGRSASQRRSLERTAQRGFLPSSGLAELDARGIDQQYDQLAGQANRDLAINAISRRDQNLQQALGIGQMGGMAIPQFLEGQAAQRRNESLNLANLLYQMPRTSLYDALAVTGSAPPPTDNFGNAVQLANQNFQQQQLNDQRNAQLMSALGQWFVEMFGG